MTTGATVTQTHTEAHSRTEQILHELLSPTGIFASGDRLFRNAVFGRDSLEVAEDIVVAYPSVAKTIIRTIATLQGTKHDYLSEEEPGRIHHEHRGIAIGDTKTNETSLAIMRSQIAKWGGDEHSMTYYGAVDATPLFVRVVDEFCRAHGDAILHETIINKDGDSVSILDCVRHAIEWTCHHLEASHVGLLEFKRTQPHGHKVQAWKDSEEFYTHPDGSEITSGIASIEVQGLAYDALMIACKLFPEQKDDYQAKAKHIQEKVFKGMWLEDEHYFALGFDYNHQGQPRLIRTITANPGELLDTTIFDNLPELEKEHYIGAILAKLFSPEFLTHAGIRSRSLVHGELIHFWDYHGSFVTWPKETYDIARGLRRQGFEHLAEALEERLQLLCRMTGRYPEFVYVEDDGTLLISHIPDGGKNRTVVAGTNIPERVQAWTLSAIIGIEYEYKHHHRSPQHPWQHKLEQSLISFIPKHRGSNATPTELMVLGSYSLTGHK